MLTAVAYSTHGVPLIPREIRPALAEITYATILSADLRGFAALTEKLPALMVASLLREFSAAVTHAVFEWGGQPFPESRSDTAALAAFGLRDIRHTHLQEALAAARGIQKRFASIRTNWRERFSVHAAVGIGVSRGEVALGVQGTHGHALATLGGETPSLASLLCKRARAGEVLLYAAAHLPPPYSLPAAEPVPPSSFVFLPHLKLQGRDAPVDAWCLPAPVRLEMPRPPS